jgi:hypothetical protein
MATLKNSRGKFFEVHRMPRDRSFWYYVIEQQGRLNELADEDVARLLAWKPECSNCPELTEVIGDLIHKVPAEWRALANNIFVGRVFNDGEANAKAWTRVKAGIIEINLQYTWVLNAYVAAFDDYARTVSDLIQKILEPGEDMDQVVRALDDRLSKRRYWLDESRPEWLDLGMLSIGKPALLQSTPPDRIEIRDNAVGACEAFAIAHELAHHLLWHTVSRSGKSKAWQAVEATIANAGIADIISRQNSSQRQELHADILAFMITANAINGTPTFNGLYGALVGSMISHVALADVNESWIEKDASASHPDFIARCEVIAALTEWLSKSRPAGSVGDHPLGLLVQLQGFLSLAINAWLNRGAPNKVRRASVLDITDHALKLALEAHNKIPAKP